jgi:NitT/TauT family transport system substrate-binding protein
VGKTIISFAEAPTPWQCMLTVLRRNGVDPATVRIERHRPGPEALAAFRGGHGDFFEQTQPIVEQLLAGGEAHLVASMGEATGPVPFTSYMTTPEFLRREPDTVLHFTRALYRTQRWLASHDSKDIADAIKPGFPDIAPTILERAVGRFARQGTWSSDPILRRPGFDYLQDILKSGGFISKTHRYEDLVDTAIAEQAVVELEGKV